jgi:aminopeptidase N
MQFVFLNRQAQYLFNPGVTTQGTEQGIGGTVVHEIAHMWFGDIVSPLWYGQMKYRCLLDLLKY